MIACTAWVSSSSPLSYTYPLPAAEDGFVLTFGVRATVDATIAWSTDGTFNNIKYEMSKFPPSGSSLITLATLSR